MEEIDDLYFDVEHFVDGLEVIDNLFEEELNVY